MKKSFWMDGENRLFLQNFVYQCEIAIYISQTCNPNQMKTRREERCPTGMVVNRPKAARTRVCCTCVHQPLNCTASETTNVVTRCKQRTNQLKIFPYLVVFVGLSDCKKVAAPVHSFFPRAFTARWVLERFYDR